MVGGRDEEGAGTVLCAGFRVQAAGTCATTVCSTQRLAATAAEAGGGVRAKVERGTSDTAEQAIARARTRAQARRQGNARKMAMSSGHLSRFAANGTRAHMRSVRLCIVMVGLRITVGQ